MSTLRIAVKDSRKNFRPGEVIEGAIGWETSESLRAIEIRFFWYTRGKGTEDVQIVDETRLESPDGQGAAPFRFTAPDHPPSFSGKLISVLWAVEAVALPRGGSARAELVIGPDGHELDLNSLHAALAT